MNNKEKINIGSSILTVGYLGLSSVFFIIAKDADLDTATGRHLLAGALANIAFSFAQIMIANFALRKGERWAWWSNLIPAFGYGATILIIDATHVQPAKLIATLAPQAAGIIILSVGLIITGIGLFKK